MCNIINHLSVLSPIENIDLSQDKRLLIPFITQHHKMGMMDKNRKVILPAVYDAICSDCYSKSDLIKVAMLHPYGFINRDNEVDARVKYHYGLIDISGNIILEVKYTSIFMPISSSVYAVCSDEGNAVLNKSGEIIVPFKRYSYIDGFDGGFARVNVRDDKGRQRWGMINEKGEEVLPLEYSNIWNFYGKGRLDTKIEKDGIEKNIPFSELSNQ